MKTPIFLIFLILFTSSNCFSNGFDGTKWEQLSPKEKVAYAAGYYNGMKTGGFYVIGNIEKVERAKIYNKFAKIVNHGLISEDLAQIVMGIDSFYSNYANLKIPFEFANSVVIHKIDGENKKYIEDLIIKIKKRK